MICLLFLFNNISKSQNYSIFAPQKSYLIDYKNSYNPFEQSIITGAERLDVYLSKLQNKNVAVFANQTSIIRTKNNNLYIHLIDTLIALGINIKKIFVPEHGFTGYEGAGDTVKDYTDPITNIKFISLYGEKKMPTEHDLKDVDVVLFDIQDVGVRFYTYISSLEYLMTSLINNKKELIILDRPNPNSFYVDGPVLNKNFKSFVGMQQIPVVYGMTIGEYATMIYFEHLEHETLDTIDNFKLSVVLCLNYDHKYKYNLPVKPSPNLKTMKSIYLYPSLCFFEGTNVSLGRGTNNSFQCYGYPKYKLYDNSVFKFTPISMTSAKNPIYLNTLCRGENLINYNFDSDNNSYFTLKWLLNAYENFPNKSNFFISKFFNSLVGNNELIMQIKAQKDETFIRNTWKNKIEEFIQLRKKYLLYDDF